MSLLQEYRDNCFSLLNKYDNILLIEPYGNVGDKLITESTLHILRSLNKTFTHLRCDKVTPKDCKEKTVMWGGGGNMGDFYIHNRSQRDRIFPHCDDLVILPQTWTSPEIVNGKKYVREIESLNFTNGELAIDLSFGLSLQYSEPSLDTGVFFRVKSEPTIIPNENIGDPAELCHNPPQYIDLASNYKTIHTNRLHFAICGILLGREVYLHSGRYFKNRSFYNTWLRELDNVHFIEDSTKVFGNFRRASPN